MASKPIRKDDNVSRGSRVPPPNMQTKSTVANSGGFNPSTAHGASHAGGGAHPHPPNTNQNHSKPNQVAPAHGVHPEEHRAAHVQEMETQTEEKHQGGILSFFKPMGFFVPCVCCRPRWLLLSCWVFGVLHIIFAIYTLHNIVNYGNAVKFCDEVEKDTECKENGTVDNGTYNCDDLKYICNNYKIAIAADIGVTFVAHTTIGILLLLTIAMRCRRPIFFLIAIGLMVLQCVLQTIITIVYRFPVVDKGVDLGIYDSVNSGASHDERQQIGKAIRLYFSIKVGISIAWTIGLSLLYFSNYQMIKHNENAGNMVPVPLHHEGPPNASYYAPAIQSHPFGSPEVQMGDTMAYDKDQA